MRFAIAEFTSDKKITIKVFYCQNLSAVAGQMPQSDSSKEYSLMWKEIIWNNERPNYNV